ncbi:MAG: hypothetical protein ABIB79_02675 [archaeon]
MKSWNNNIKKFDVWDIKLIKLSVVAFVCLIISLWPRVGVYIMAVDWWWFLAALVLLAWRPMKKWCCK